MSYEDLFMLTKEKTELELKVNCLKNKLNETQNLLNIMIQNQSIPNKKRKTNTKMDFYHEHKNDEDIVKKIELYKQTFPNVKVPWMFVKALTDAKLKI